MGRRGRTPCPPSVVQGSGRDETLYWICDVRAGGRTSWLGYEEEGSLMGVLKEVLSFYSCPTSWAASSSPSSLSSSAPPFSSFAFPCYLFLCSPFLIFCFSLLWGF